MISATRTLPDGYIQTHEINLAKNKRLAILLNIVGFIIFVLSFVLLGLFVRRVRTDLSTITFTMRGDLSALLQLLGLFLLVALIMVVHELIHGLFFWVFTRSKPAYALRRSYAYAAAPDWFIPFRQYWIIGLAPLVLIDAIGILLILLAPTGWILPILLLVALNTAGSIGDMLITLRLLRLSPASLAKDTGDSVCFFEPDAAMTKSV
jgi:hypothetical protein